MNDTADTYLRTIRSFVKRAGRMTGAQKQAMEQLWPRFGLELQAGPLVPAEVFGRQAPLVLEIGFGMGDSLIAMAQQHPEWDYVGVEVYPPGIGNLLKLAEADAVDNLRVYEADAKEVLSQAVADASLDRIQIFFPDPWHKKKHHKRRLIQPDFVAELRSKLKPGGILHLATDWEHYALQMMEVLSQAPGMRNCQGVGQWAVEHGRSGTKF